MSSQQVSTAQPSNVKPLSSKWNELLSDSLLGFLALSTLFLGFSPLIFDLSESTESILSVIENAILVVFALEYLIGLYVAQSKKSYVLNGWRILDALIILIGILALMPFVADQFKHALSLRLLRFIRIALFSAKIRGVVPTQENTNQTNSVVQGEVTALNFETASAANLSWDEVTECLKSVQEDWLLAGNIHAKHLADTAEILKVPLASLTRLMFESQFPRIERMDKYTTLFLWFPSLVKVEDNQVPSIRRDGMLLLGSEHNVLVLSQNSISLGADMLAQSKELDDNSSLLVSNTWAFLRVIILRYTEIIDHLEKSLLSIDTQQKSMSDKVFLDTTFRLRSELIRMRSNIKHLSQCIRQLAEKPISIKGFSKPPQALFAILFDDAQSLYDGLDDLLNNLSAVVELRLNISSFQMNKVMRLLAILTTLTLIPAITGGMLGMNLLDNPWPLSLAEVTYCVAAGMSFSLYIFAIKGWFR